MKKLFIFKKIFVITCFFSMAMVSCESTNSVSIEQTTPTIEKSIQEKDTEEVATKKISNQVLISDYKTYQNIDEKIKLEKINVAQTLDQPWGMDFVDSNTLIITEKKGNLILFDLNKKISKDIKHDIPVVQSGQGGLLDVVFFEQFLYLSFTKLDENLKLTTAIGRGKFIKPFNTLDDFQIIFEAKPYYSDRIHFGSRIVIKDNYLYASIGERGQGIAAQKVDSHAGSIIRINLDGSILINLSPSLNSIFLFILIIFIGLLLTSNPTNRIFSINSLADPSKIGTSSLSISIKALSIPRPNKAPIKCSIVETFTPYSLDIVVFKEVLLTLAKFG